MAGRTPDSLAVRKAVEAGKIPPVWLWVGPETFLKDELFTKVAEAVTGDDATGMNVLRFRGGETPVEEILSACLTLPMLAERRTVIVRAVEKLTKKERDRLAEYAAKPAPETALVLATTQSKSEGIGKLLGPVGVDIRVFDHPRHDDIVQWIELRFRDRGKQCPRAVAEALLDRCGSLEDDRTPLDQVAPEIEKAALAAGERDEILPEDLEVISRKAYEEELYRLVSCATVGDLPGALTALDSTLLFKNNPPVRIVATLTHRFLMLAKTRDQLDQGMGAGAIRIWPFSAKEDVMRGARARSSARLQRSLLALAQADQTLKSRPTRPRWVLEKTLTELTAR